MVAKARIVFRAVPAIGLLAALHVIAADPGTNVSSAAAVIVTARRVEQLAHDVPQYVDTLSESELRIEKAARTVPEALADQTATLVQKTGHGQGSPYIRGFTGFRNLFLIDGIRLNNSVFRDGPNQYWNTVDALTIRRLEVVKGPASSLYGTDAVGGTVNALTQRREDYSAGFNWDRSIYSRYSSAENSIMGRAEVSANLDDTLGFIIGYSYKDFGDLEGGENVGTQRMTGYDEQDWNMRVDYFPDEESIVTFAHQGVEQDDAWRTHKTIYGISWEGTVVGKEKRRSLDQNRALTYLQYERGNIGGICNEIRLGVSHHRQGEERLRIKSDDRSDIQGFDVDTYGVFAHLRAPSPAGDITYGIDAYRDNVDSYSTSYNADGSLRSRGVQGPVADDATYDTIAVFLRDEVPVHDRVTLALGTRYDYSTADAGAVEDPQTGNQLTMTDHWAALVSSARIMCDLSADGDVRVFAGAAQGFRAPNLSDLTRLDSARSNEIETPSPGLDPEDFVTYEVGLRAKRPTWSSQLVYYHTDIDGMIVRTPTGRIIDGESEVTKRNGGNGFVRGIEAEAEWEFHPRFTVFGNFTWTDGEVETYPTSAQVLVAEPIDRLMPPTGRAGLKWGSSDCWIEASCTMAARADKLSTRDAADTQRIPPAGTSGYAAFDVRAGCRVTEILALSVAVENLTNEDYRTHGSGLNEAGRNYILAADWVF